MLFEPKQVQSAISPNTFNAQDAGIYSQTEITKFSNRAIVTKHSEIRLGLFGKAISDDVSATSEQNPIDLHSPSNRNRFNPYNVERSVYRIIF